MEKLVNSVDLDDIQQKLYDKLKPSGWTDKLKTFILSEDFGKILLKLLNEAKEGKRFTPVLKQLFRCFEECPYKDLKVVMIGQDPYPQPSIADGIAFSCSNDTFVPASLKFMFKEVEDTVYPGQGYTWDPDLKKWANQGVLLINTAFTTTLNKVGVHYNLWQPFMTFLLDMLSFNNPGIVYVFMGKVAQGWMEQVPDNNHKLITSHPASAAHREIEKWDSDDVFNKTNEILKSVNNTKIIW